MARLPFFVRYAPIPALLLALATTACQSAGGSTPPDEQPTGPLAAQYVGVWQESLASAGDYYDSGSGTTFTMTSGYNAVLKLRSDGDYYFSFFAAGVQDDCAYVSHWDQSVGVARIDGSTLTLVPRERQLNVTDCRGDRAQTVANDPMVFDLTLEEQLDFNGMRVHVLELTGDVVPLTLTALQQPPSAAPYAPEQPADFELGDGTPAPGLVGTWRSEPDAPTDFYDPETGTFALPGDGEFDYEQVLIEPGAYELARTWTEYDVTGICQKDYVYFERGTPTWAQVLDIYDDGEYLIGHARFEATEAALVVQVRECGDDDGAYRFDLVPVTSYYQWDLSAAGADASVDPAQLILSCPWELSEWQFMICGGFDQMSIYFTWE